MNTPLYVVQVDDATPIPTSNFILDIPLNDPYFNPIERTVTGSSEKELQIIIGLTYSDPQELMSNPFQLATEMEPIGILCTIDSIEEVTNFNIVSLTANRRIKLTELNSVLNTTTKKYTYTAPDTYTDETFYPGQDVIIGQIKQLISTINDNPTKFNKNLIVKINQHAPLLMKLDYIADYLITDSYERANYLTIETFALRLNTVLKRLSEVLQVKTTKRKKPKATKLVEKTFQETLEEIPFPENVKEKIQRDINKLNTLPISSTEYSLVLDYLTWATEIPWGKYSHKEFELSSFIGELNKTHYGLDEVKEHLLEYMTIEKLTNHSSGAVLCFIGEPGTGKTSIAKSIARVANRQLQTIALGGLADESDLRGHRRTYSASRPGRFITGLKYAGQMDPVFLLDEVDKIAKHKGDPTAALLEILDPEQNHTFIDRYMEIPVDLSKALFICTANYEEQIPPALKDRMEFIEFRKYSKEERLTILSQFLLPKAITAYCLNSHPIIFTEEIINFISDTKDIRKMEKQVKKLLRQAAVEIEINKTDKVIVNKTFAKHTYKKQINRLGF